MDEGVLLVYPELILKGSVPYRDFETFYGPANICVLAGVYSIFGSQIFTERAVGLVYRVLILLAVFSLTRRWGAIIAAGSTIMTALALIGLGIVAYAWIGAIACGLWSLCFLARLSSPKDCLCGGILAGAAMLFRPDLAPALILSALSLFGVMTIKGRVTYLLGGIISSLPLLLFSALAGPRSVIKDLFLLPVFYTSPARHLPIFSAERPVQILLLLHLCAATCGLIAGGLAIRSEPHSRNARLLLAAAVFAVGLTPQALQRLDSIHVLFVASVSLGLLPLSLKQILATERFGRSGRMKDCLAVAIALGTVCAFVPEMPAYMRNELTTALRADSSQAFFVTRHDRTFPFATVTAVRVTARMLDQLDRLSSPGQRLFVGPADLRRAICNDTFLYHMMPQLRPATYFLEMNPLSANRVGSRLASDVESADWLILNRAWDAIEEPNASMRFGPDAPNLVVQTQFEQCGEFGTYLLYRHNPRTKTASSLAQF